MWYENWMNDLFNKKDVMTNSSENHRPTVKQLMYEEWLEFYDIEEKFEKCLECSGLGKCSYCKNGICVDCDGDGRFSLTLIEYNNQFHHDKQLLEKLYAQINS